MRTFAYLHAVHIQSNQLKKLLIDIYANRMTKLLNQHDFLLKIAQFVDFSTDIPDSEKKDAEEALLRLEEATYHLKQATEHLNVLYDPFSEHDSISTKSVVKKRGVLNRFKQASKEKFENFKRLCILAIQKLNNFSKGDMEIQEIIGALESAIIDIEQKLEKFYDVLSDYESPDFRNDVLSTIDDVRRKSEEFNDLVYDRIIEHINANLIGKTWMSDAEDRLNLDVKEHTPLLLELFKQRQQMLDGKYPNMGKDTQALNPSDAQRVYYPDAVRNVNFTEFGD